MRFQNPEDSLIGVSWLVAISATFLLIGVWGLLGFRAYEPITFSGRAGIGAVDNDSTDTSMAELLSEIASPEITTQTEVAEVETPEVPDVVEPTIETPDLPELTEALTTEDVFAVPAAPKIEVAQKVIEPSKPKPKPKENKPRPKSKNTGTTNQPASGTTAAPGGTTGSGGGGGGSGTAGSGAGRGRMPLPAYPSRARARGVVGSVTLRMIIGPAGRITSATVVSTNLTNGGFTSAEQGSVAADVRRNWFLPDRANQTLTLPIQFKLR